MPRGCSLRPRPLFTYYRIITATCWLDITFYFLITNKPRCQLN
ncbi:hypothetical protein UUU_07220 [Klebsiella pneumoniae subsp. pneumoniae DSM 30104 = JCM 1662 = NBRC 14940]|nr:hypothetical protein UUU_07220 [Klebsiella pneumoniae subsp. pneumoniae DSM 30104 = JCM 1662 = NBRC 14940]